MGNTKREQVYTPSQISRDKRPELVSKTPVKLASAVPNKHKRDRQLPSPKRHGFKLFFCLFSIFFVCLALNFWGQIVGIIRLNLITNNIGPWAKYNPVIKQYAKTLKDAGPWKREALLKVARSSRDISEIVQEQARKHKVSSSLIEVLLSKESSGGINPSIRFEPTWMTIAKQISSNDIEQKMLSSSHGPMQIAGWWVEEYNKMSPRFRGVHTSWTDLYDLEFNVELGTLILKQCLQKNPRKSRNRQIWEGFRCFNGSGPQAVTYANDAYRRLAEKLIGQL